MGQREREEGMTTKVKLTPYEKVCADLGTGRLEVADRERIGRNGRDLLASAKYFAPCLEHRGDYETWRTDKPSYTYRRDVMPLALLEACAACFQGSMDTWVVKGYRAAVSTERAAVTPAGYKPWYERSSAIVSALFPHPHQYPTKEYKKVFGYDYDKWEVQDCCWQAAWDSYHTAWGR